MKVRKLRDRLKEELKDKKFRKEFEAEDIYVKLAIQIAMLREKRGWSQKDLARKLHTSQQTISRLEDPGNNGISLHTLVKLAQAFRKRLKIGFI